MFWENAMCPDVEVGVLMRDDGAFTPPSPELDSVFLTHLNHRL